MINNFKKHWELRQATEDEYLIKAKLTKSEISEVQKTIRDMQASNQPSSKIIKTLQSKFAKLSEKWKAERAYYTEASRINTDVIHDSSENLEFDTYKVLLSPHACEVCMKKTENGKKIFKSNEISKAGYGHKPPFHSNCYCLLLPNA